MMTFIIIGFVILITLLMVFMVLVGLRFYLKVSSVMNILQPSVTDKESV